MAYVPAAREYQQVCFSSPRRFLDASGFQNVRSVDDAVPILEQQSLTEEPAFSLQPVSVPSLYTDYWKDRFLQLTDTLSLDLFAVDDLLSTGSEYLDVVRGSFDGEAIGRVLEEQGYGREDHSGVPFYAISGDFEPTFIVNEKGFETLTELGALVIDRMNRVWLQDGALVAASATQIMTDAMDAASGRIPSILDRPEYRRTAEGLGPVHAACLLNPAQYTDEALLRSTTSPEPRPELVERLPSQYPEWDHLDPPSLVALAYYREPDEMNVFKVGLWYADKQKAKTNATELEKRLAQYQSESWGKPLCDEVEARSQAWSDGSLAVAQCRGGLARWWTTALQMKDLLFLLERLPGQ